MPPKQRPALRAGNGRLPPKSPQGTSKNRGGAPGVSAAPGFQRYNARPGVNGVALDVQPEESRKARSAPAWLSLESPSHAERLSEKYRSQSPHSESQGGNLHDMLQRVNAKIERLMLESLPPTPTYVQSRFALKETFVTPPSPTDISQTPSQNLAREIECRLGDLQVALEYCLHAQPSENLPAQKFEPEDLQLHAERSKLQLQVQGLTAEVDELQKEKKSLKDELLAVRGAAPCGIEVATQTEVQEVSKTNLIDVPVFSEGASACSRGRSSKADSLEGLQVPVRAKSLSSPRATDSSALSRSTSPIPTASLAAAASSSVRSYPTTSPVLCSTDVWSTCIRSRSPSPQPAVVTSTVLEEYVQVHSEPMQGGWREFYQPKSMAIQSIGGRSLMLPARGSLSQQTAPAVLSASQTRALSSSSSSPSRQTSGVPPFARDRSSPSNDGVVSILAPSRRCGNSSVTASSANPRSQSAACVSLTPRHPVSYTAHHSFADKAHLAVRSHESVS